MSDIKKLLARIGTVRDAISRKEEQTSLDYMIDGVLMNCSVMLKEQEIEEPHPWEHIWDAPDYSFKGKCRNCGFIHYFIQGHDVQYRFCPQCGEQKVI